VAGATPRAGATAEHLQHALNGVGIRTHRDGVLEELDRRFEVPSLDLALRALDDLSYGAGRSRRAHSSHPHAARATTTSGCAPDVSEGAPTARRARPAHRRTSSTCTNVQRRSGRVAPRTGADASSAPTGATCHARMIASTAADRHPDRSAMHLVASKSATIGGSPGNAAGTRAAVLRAQTACAALPTDAAIRTP
jgi:hypothetical protein